MKFFSQVLTIIFVALFSNAVFATQRTDSFMSELKDALEQRDVFVSQKLEKIRNFHLEADSAVSLYDKFEAVGHLLDEYRSFNSDSAMKMCEERLKIAQLIGDRKLIDNAKLNIAEILYNTGMYKESLDLMDDIPSGRLPEYLLPYYFHLHRTVYGLLRDYSIRQVEIDRYSSLTDAYRDSIISVNRPGSIAYVITMADKLNSQNKFQDAINVIEDYFNSGNCSDHDRAICAYSLAKSYQCLGDTIGYKEQLIISSISDVRAAIREYVSLRELAFLLYSEGEVNDAYQFLQIAMDDAVKCNARIRVLEINKVFPIVNKVYYDTIHAQQTRLRWALAAISILLIILIITMVYLYKQMQRVAQARKEIEVVNDSLRKLNAELTDYVEKLRQANNSIEEHSRLKEAYIAQYMEQSSDYIDKMDRYRMALRNLVSSGKITELTKELKSTTFLDDELKSFYQSFDETFLRLFPTFVEDFNKLLLPGQEIIPKKPKQLNTELRIFALIRLGITDSTKISCFLRYSLSTIYNYRTKVRNKAAGNRDALEEELMKIG